MSQLLTFYPPKTMEAIGNDRKNYNDVVLFLAWNRKELKALDYRWKQ